MKGLGGRLGSWGEGGLAGWKGGEGGVNELLFQSARFHSPVS